MTKKCKICNIEKDESEFYKTGKYLRPYCKECSKKRDVEWQRNNPDKIEALRNKHREKRIESDRVYRYYNREKLSASKKTYRKENPHKKRAHSYMKNLIAQGVNRPDHCEVCGIKCIPHGHHDDYYKPLEVRWLCRSCHRKHHVKLEKEKLEKAQLEKLGGTNNAT